MLYVCLNLKLTKPTCCENTNTTNIGCVCHIAFLPGLANTHLHCNTVWDDVPCLLFSLTPHSQSDTLHRISTRFSFTSAFVQSQRLKLCPAPASDFRPLIPYLGTLSGEQN